MRLQLQARAGMTVVESAVVFPVTFLLILGLLVGGRLGPLPVVHQQAAVDGEGRGAEQHDQADGHQDAHIPPPYGARL